MVFFINPYRNVFFNLAAEEYLVNHFPNGFCSVWMNDDAVVCGKHQNLLAEINLPFVRKNKITVARRISGGGTVVHDKGNLNFTIALPVPESGLSIDFHKFIAPIIEFLKRFKIDAVAGEKSDILVHGKKFSGNAEHHHRKNNLILHHGTLLYNSDLNKLSQTLKNSTHKYTHKAVASRPSPVTNLIEYISNPPDIDTFKIQLSDFLVEYYTIEEVRNFSCEETDQIEALAVTKFEKEAWNYGYSPAYFFQNNFTYLANEYEIQMKVQREGIISEVAITGVENTNIQNLKENLINQKHFPSVINAFLRTYLPLDSSENDHPLLPYFF